MASKRDYYAEEQAIEIEKLRVENKENVENHETICTFLTTQEASDPNAQFARILELEAEVRILKASNKKYKIQIFSVGAFSRIQVPNVKTYVFLRYKFRNFNFRT